MKKRELHPEEYEILKEFGLKPTEEMCALSFLSDELLFRQGQPIEWFMIILKGTADVQLQDHLGNKLSLGYSITHGALGDIEMLMESPVSTSSVIALTPMLCLGIPYDYAIAEHNRNIKFATYMADCVSRAFDLLQVAYVNALLSTGEQRLCTYIANKVMKDGIYRGTLSEAAAVIGVSYRHIFRMMTKLCEDGILSKEKDGYHILDMDALRSKTFI